MTQNIAWTYRHPYVFVHLILNCFATVLSQHPIRPPTIPNPDIKECAKFCDAHRPANVSSTDVFKITCNNLDDDSQKEDCSRKCRYCQQFNFCEMNNNAPVLKCYPENLIEGTCKDRCDYWRQDDFLGEFIFDCGNATLFPSKWDKRQCKEDCKTCSAYICRTRYIIPEGEVETMYSFHCPTVETFPVRPIPPPSEPEYENSRCEFRCDFERPNVVPGKQSEEGYKLDCFRNHRNDKKEREECIDDCNNCPLDVCDPQKGNQGLGSKNAVFQCPVARKEKKPEPPSATKYAGSWTVIGLIACAVIGCIVGAAYYGRRDGRDDQGGNRVAPAEVVVDQPGTQLEKGKTESGKIEESMNADNKPEESIVVGQESRKSANIDEKTKSNP